MTTAAQVKKLVQPLLMRNPNLVLVGRLLVVKPVTHILRSIFFDASWDNDLFRPYWSLNMMFEPNTNHGPTWGHRIYPKVKELWLFSDPDVSEAVCNQVEGDTLHVLRSVNSIDDFVSYATKENFPDTRLDAFPHRRVYVDIARGDFDAANALCEMMADRRSRSSFWSEQYDPILIHVWPHIKRRNKSTLAKMLHQWEAEAAKRMKLENIWEPTPFPLEMK